MLILITAGYLRNNRYAEVPFPGDSVDEYSFSWVGLSLIRLGVPVGGIGVGGYSNKIYGYVNPDGIFHTGRYNNPLEINYPWFDHPPLLGLVTGGYAYLKGARGFEDVSLALVRRPMVGLGILSVGLLIWLGWEMYDKKTGLVAGLIYAVSPLAVVGSRMVQAENGFIPLLLGMMIAMTKYEKNSKVKYLIMAAILAGLGIWVKLAGVIIIAVMGYELWRAKKKNINQWRWVGLIFGGCVLAYLVYGAAYDGKTFMAVFGANTDRYYGMGTNAIWELWTKMRITHTKFMTDGWILSGWIAVLALLIKKTVKPIHGAAIIIYLAIYLIFGNYPYGWYAWPFLPLIFLGLGKVVTDTLNNQSDYTATGLLLFMPAGIAISQFFPGEALQKYSAGWRMAMGGGLGWLLWGKGAKWLILLLLALGCGISIVFVVRLTPEFWYKVI